MVIGAVTVSTVTSAYNYIYHFFAPIRSQLLGYDYLGWGIGIWILAILADDFSYYWLHRSGHEVRILWACHIVHHSSPNYNFSTAVRNAWMANCYKHLYWLWMPVLGFDPIMIFTCIAINQVYQFFLHTIYLPGWDKLSWFFNTPGLHAIHHGSNPHCIDKNYGGIFIFFDRLLGTYEPIREGIALKYGVTHPPKTEQVGEVLFHEFRSLFRSVKRTPSWKNKILLMLKPPGWKPTKETIIRQLNYTQLEEKRA